MKFMTLTAFLLLMSSTSFGALTPEEAVKKLNGKYELALEPWDSKEICDSLAIEMDLSYKEEAKNKLLINSFSTGEAVMDDYVQRPEVKVLFGTRDEGKTAFIEFKKNNRRFFKEGSVYGNTVERLTFSIEESSETLRLEATEKWHGILNGPFVHGNRSLGSNPFFMRNEVGFRCHFKKII